jgi:hypothetical protein
MEEEGHLGQFRLSTVKKQEGNSTVAWTPAKKSLWELKHLHIFIIDRYKSALEMRNKH